MSTRHIVLVQGGEVVARGDVALSIWRMKHWTGRMYTEAGGLAETIIRYCTGGL